MAHGEAAFVMEEILSNQTLLNASIYAFLALLGEAVGQKLICLFCGFVSVVLFVLALI